MAAEILRRFSFDLRQRADSLQRADELLSVQASVFFPTSQPPLPDFTHAHPRTRTRKILVRTFDWCWLLLINHQPADVSRPSSLAQPSEWEG